MTTEKIRLAVRVEIDDTLPAGRTTVEVESGIGGETVDRVNGNCLANLLMAFGRQVQGDYFETIRAGHV